MLLAEDLLILTIDPAGGLVGDGSHASSRDALARSLLVELVTLGAVTEENGILRVVDLLPQSHRLLNEAAHALADTKLTPEKAVARLRRRMWSVRSDLLEGFERLGILHRLSGGLFGRFGGSRYALQSTQTRAERLAKLRRGFDAPTLQDLSSLALAILTEWLGLSPYFLSREQRQKMRVWVSKALLTQADDTPELRSNRQRLALILSLLPLK